eukprot:1988998-Pleurochrysis_carterae.AAC.1
MLGNRHVQATELSVEIDKLRGAGRGVDSGVFDARQIPALRAFRAGWVGRVLLDGASLREERVDDLMGTGAVC